MGGAWVGGSCPGALTSFLQSSEDTQAPHLSGALHPRDPEKQLFSCPLLSRGH